MIKGLAALFLTTTCLGSALACSASTERLKSEAPAEEDGNNFTIDGITYHSSERTTTLLGEEYGMVTLEKVSEKFIADAKESKVLAFPEEVEYNGRKYLLWLIADRVLEGFDLTPIEEIVFPQWLQMPGAGNYNDMPNLTKVVFGKNMLTTGLQNFHNMPLLRSIELPELMEHAGESMWGLGIEELRFPPDFRMMFHSFIGLPNLRVLDVGNTPTLNCCLYGLESLEEMTVPATLEIIDDSMQDMPSFRRLVIAQRETMLNIYKSFYLTENFSDVYVENETPFELKLTFPAPSWSDYDEKPFNERTVLHVPTGSREAYAGAPVWETFKEIVEYDKAGVEAAESVDGDVRVVADRAGVTVSGIPGMRTSVFTTDGRTVYRGTAGDGILRIDLPAGLYIVRAGDSTVKLRI